MRIKKWLASAVVLSVFAGVFAGCSMTEEAPAGPDYTEALYRKAKAKLPLLPPREPLPLVRSVRPSIHAPLTEDSNPVPLLFSVMLNNMMSISISPTI